MSWRAFGDNSGGQEQCHNVVSAQVSQVRLVSTPSNPRNVLADTSDKACLEAYQREFDYLVRTLRRLGVSPEDVEDLAHEIFLVLRRTWNEYNPERALKPYLFGIAFRVAASHRRKYWREVPFATVEGQDRAPYPDEVMASNQARALVLTALERIPLKRRAVLIMHDLDEVPVQDVAATLSIPLFTAYSRLRKARRELESAVISIQRRSVVR
jgi:RNA polymerase sigma-70 factor, ECF subfamily